MNHSLTNGEGQPIRHDQVMTLMRLCAIAGGFFDTRAQIAQVWAQNPVENMIREYLRGQAELICEAGGLPLDMKDEVVRFLSEPTYLNHQVALWTVSNLGAF